MPNRLTRVCCEVDGQVQSAVSFACDPGSARPKEDCDICCVFPTGGGEYSAAVGLPHECPEDGLQLEAAACLIHVCCGEDGGTRRVICEAEGREIESENQFHCRDIG